jgi:predicted nucleic acid-binding protein
MSAFALREAYLIGKIALAEPSLVVHELANVLRYKDDLTTPQVRTAVQSLYDMGLKWVVPSSAVMQRAISIARLYETTVYDAVFASLAESLKGKFITADERLARRFGALSFVYFLTDPIAL